MERVVTCRRGEIRFCCEGSKRILMQEMASGARPTSYEETQVFTFKNHMRDFVSGFNVLCMQEGIRMPLNRIHRRQINHLLPRLRSASPAARRTAGCSPYGLLLHRQSKAIHLAPKSTHVSLPKHHRSPSHFPSPLQACTLPHRRPYPDTPSLAPS